MLNKIMHVFLLINIVTPISVYQATSNNINTNYQVAGCLISQSGCDFTNGQLLAYAVERLWL